MASRIVMIPKRVLSAQDAEEYVGGSENLERLKGAGWVKALKGKQRGMDYDVKELDSAIDRVYLMGWPERKRA